MRIKNFTSVILLIAFVVNCIINCFACGETLKASTFYGLIGINGLFLLIPSFILIVLEIVINRLFYRK